MFSWMRCRICSDVLEHLFSAMREQHSINGDVEYRGLYSISAEVHLDGTKAQGIGKSRGGWIAVIRMISASNWMAMIFSLFGGHAHEAKRPAGKLGEPDVSSLRRPN